MTKNSIFGNYADKIPEALKLLTEQDEYSYRHRKLRMFNLFTEFVESNYVSFTDENYFQIASHFRSHTFSERGNNSIVTTNHDYRAWHALMKDLMSMRAIAGKSVPPALKNTNALLKQSHKIPCLGTMNPRTWKQSFEQKDLSVLQSIQDQEYLEAFIDHQISSREKMLIIARKYITEATTRFSDGQRFISETSPSNYDCPNLYHPTLKAPGSGQRLSLFSKNLPDVEALRNLVGYLHHLKDGYCHNDFIGGTNHVPRCGGRVNVQEHLGLSSNLAAACAIVITSETGINPTSLYNMKLDSDDNIITPNNDDGTYTLKYNKPRAGGHLSRNIRSGKEKINAEYCFDLIQKLTANYRSKATTKNQRFLFIHDGSSRNNTIDVMGPSCFKSSLKRLIVSSGDFEFTASLPSLSKLRVTGGIIAWHQSGGDPRAASRFLGNSAAVAIKNYIPKELQEFFYRKQIRQFQNLLIAIATDDKPYQAEALNITNKADLDSYLSNHVTTSDLYKRTIAKPNEDTVNRVTFVISDTNIAFLHGASETYKKEPIENRDLKNWSEIANVIFGYIRSNGTRRQQHLMANGITLYKNSPLNLCVNTL